MAKWQQKYRVGWDATDGRKWRSSADSLGNFVVDGEVQIPSGLGPGPGEGLRAGESPCGVGVGNALQFPKEDLAGALWFVLSTRCGYSSKDVWRSRS